MLHARPSAPVCVRGSTPPVARRYSLNLCVCHLRCGTVFPVSAVVVAAVPAAVCRWGLCPCCPGVGRCLSGYTIIIIDVTVTACNVRGPRVHAEKVLSIIYHASMVCIYVGICINVCYI